MALLTVALILIASTTCIAQTPNIKVVIHSMEGYGQYEAFGRKAAAAFERVLRSEKFHQEVLAGTYLRTNGYTNAQLYAIIMKAHEKQGPGGTDSVVDLRVRTLRIDGDESDWKGNCDTNSSAHTYGIDGDNDGVTAICPQRLELWASENNIAELAGHYAHEYMHIIGFGHKNILAGQGCGTGHLFTR